MATTLRCGRFSLDLSTPRVMGIVNLTPDSFSDGGKFETADAAIAAAERLIAEGADLIDLGAESTRPGAAPVPVDVELARLMPVVTALRDASVPLSIDTMKPDVMARALDVGASMINDVRAFDSIDARRAVADRDCALCVMHMRGTPQDMQADPRYDDVVAEVTDFLRAKTEALRGAGVAADRILIDPGFGFGKTVDHNLALLERLEVLAGLGYPVLAGLSRKGMIGRLTGREPIDRLAGSVAAALAAVSRGASVVRVHDVAATVDALKVWRAMSMPMAGPGTGQVRPRAR